MTDHKFQVWLSNQWKDYLEEENKILLRAYLSGNNASYTTRGYAYKVFFDENKQVNMKSGRPRDIQPPLELPRPPAAFPEKTSVIFLKVKEEQPGTTIKIPHPKDKTQPVQVKVPETAKPGWCVMVPVPELPEQGSSPAAGAEGAGAVDTVGSTEAVEAPKKEGRSIAGKVAAGTAAAIGTAGLLAVAVVLGEHIAEEGGDAFLQELGDGLEGLGDAVAAGAEDVVESTGDAVAEAGDLVIDLF